MREGEKEGEDEEDEAEKEEKRHTRQPPALSTVPVLQYLSYSICLGGLLAGGGSSRLEASGKRDASTEAATSSKKGFRGTEGKERESATLSALSGQPGSRPARTKP